ncbi:penicillin-binding protein 1B [Thiococcus pfennigii]|uniref:penicillin-binding protein 1B n=1 Tax=Thiococcus pfennigii TaxID=1057 RepID=UPI001905AC26|nr:penicillin-binding protein 1B [Thiococcus pfennigii]
MAKTKRPTRPSSSTRRPTRRPKTKARTRRHPRFTLFLLRWTLLVALAGGLALALYGIHLDRVVRAKFEGKRWALPARVYAQPMELYVGRQLTPQLLRAELERLNYRALAAPERPGSYSLGGDRALVRTRAFRFWDGPEPSRLLAVSFADGRISALGDAEGGTDLPLVRLDAALIASIYPTHNEDRILVRRTDLPDLLVNALVAVEDRDFFSHFGVDPRAIARALWRNLRAGGVVEGASTLTQQLVKNFYLTHERTWERKLNEAYMAILLERRYTKDQILEAYANEIFLGQDGRRAIHGFGLASHFYFDRSLDELGIAETALLVGLIKGPSRYDPRRYPERALDRRNLVIDLMVQEGVIGREAAEQAKRTPISLRAGGGRPTGDYPAFLQLVRRQLQRDYREEDLRSEGLNIFTTLDLPIQAEVEAAVTKRLPQLDGARGFQVGTLETAAIVASVAQAEVLALVGGRDPGYAGFNRALDAVRSIGSLVKPAIYLTALSHRDRYTLATPLKDAPVSIPAGDGSRWEPKNYDHKVYGAVPLYSALARSLNLATVNLGLDLGVREVAQTLTDLGAARRFPVVPAILLGSVSLTPLEVAQVYHTIAAGGFRSPLRAIREVVDATGRPLNRYPLAVEAVADPQSVYLTTWAMQKVVQEGTARSLAARLPEGMTMAGKTGTTDDLRDSWFAGFSGNRVAAVWVGRDDNLPTKLSGSSGALPVWGDIMTAIDNEPLADFVPDGIEIVRVDRVNGLLAGEGCQRAIVIPVARGSVPTVRSDCGAGAAPEDQPARSGDEKAEDEPERRPWRHSQGRNLFLPGF